MKIDHFMLGARDLASGSRALADLVGVEPAVGGVHPERGTANALMSLGPDIYLEVIVPAPGQPAVQPFPRQLQALTGLDMRTFAVSVSDPDALAAAISGVGLALTGPFPGSRRTADGTLLQWRMFRLTDHAFAGFEPFFIDWGDTPSPALSTPTGGRFLRLAAIHPRAHDLAALYRALDLDIAVALGSRPMMLLEIVGSNGPVIFTGDGAGY